VGLLPKEIMKKYELNQLLEYIIGIADRSYDKYEEDDMRLAYIRDLCARALGKEEKLSCFRMPKFKRKKK
jgi:hypothetical protein